MKRILTLGVRDPLTRIVVWVCGAGCASAATFAAGVVGLVAVVAVLCSLLAVRLHT